MTTTVKHCPHGDIHSDWRGMNEPFVLPLELDSGARVLSVDKVSLELSTQHCPAQTVLLNFSGPCDLPGLLDYIYRAACVCVLACACVCVWLWPQLAALSCHGRSHALAPVCVN